MIRNVVVQVNKFRYKDGKGDPRGFKIFLVDNNLPKGFIPRYRGNSLHVLFHICGKFHQYHELFKDFFVNGTVSCDGLQASLRKDFDSVTAQVQAHFLVNYSPDRGWRFFLYICQYPDWPCSWYSHHNKTKSWIRRTILHQVARSSGNVWFSWYQQGNLHNTFMHIKHPTKMGTREGDRVERSSRQSMGFGIFSITYLWYSTFKHRNANTWTKWVTLIGNNLKAARRHVLHAVEIFHIVKPCVLLPDVNAIIAEDSDIWPRYAHLKGKKSNNKRPHVLLT